MEEERDALVRFLHDEIERDRFQPAPRLPPIKAVP